MILLYLLAAFLILYIGHRLFFNIRAYVWHLQLQEEVQTLCMDYDDRHYDGITNGQLDNSINWFGIKMPTVSQVKALDKKPRLKDFYTQEQINKIRA